MLENNVLLSFTYNKSDLEEMVVDEIISRTVRRKLVHGCWFGRVF